MTTTSTPAWKARFATGLHASKRLRLLRCRPCCGYPHPQAARSGPRPGRGAARGCGHRRRKRSAQQRPVPRGPLQLRPGPRLHGRRAHVAAGSGALVRSARLHGHVADRDSQRRLDQGRLDIQAVIDATADGLRHRRRARGRPPSDGRHRSPGPRRGRGAGPIDRRPPRTRFRMWRRSRHPWSSPCRPSAPVPSGRSSTGSCAR